MSAPLRVIAIAAVLLTRAFAADPAATTGAEIFIQEYRVEGARHLPRETVEETVYPFLGPGRTRDDVEAARSALEKTYRDAGFQTVAVQIPPQQVKDGVVILQVVEGVVGRLRVRGAQYFSPEQIKAQAPSLAEGSVVNFNDVPADILALNQNPDRRVTPSIKPGAEAGTVDIDLNVKDTLPLHGSLELNNRHSANTKPLRVNGSVSDNNLWQRGDSAGVSFQVAPQRTDDAKVFSGYYLTRFASGTSLMLQGTKQDSNVSTLGGAAVAGRGETLGPRLILRLPGGKDYFQSVNLGVDYKHFDQTLTVGGSSLVAPITYYPLSVAYSGAMIADGRETDAGASVTFHVRGLGSDPAAFDTRRYKSDGNFLYFHADLSHTHELPHGFQIFVRAQGQLANQSLLDSEQFSGGGSGTVRGYLESEVVGDNGAFGTLELRTPSLARLLGAKAGDTRLYAFFDAGGLVLDNPLPDQQSRFTLASYGVGGHVRFLDHYNGSFDAGMPLVSQAQTTAHNLRFTFRLWAEF